MFFFRVTSNTTVFTLITIHTFLSLAYTSCGTTGEIDGEDIIFRNLVTVRPSGANTVKSYLVGNEYVSYIVECKLPRKFNVSTSLVNVTIADSISAKTSKVFQFSSLTYIMGAYGFVGLTVLAFFASVFPC